MSAHHSRTEELARAHRLAGDAVILALRRVSLALRGYNPDQPRAPAGTPDGGRWVAEGYRLSLIGAHNRRQPNKLRVAQGYSFGTLVGQSPIINGSRDCFYKFDFGIAHMNIATKNFGCTPRVPSSAVQHGKLYPLPLNDN